ncbi:MAG: hypothetical protein D6678_07945 [Zetaproteobacteria bacterium]|nr:MAG: hypothetical protein D6678_07945 [Zetaproteobacteria bacterium]
MPLSVALVLISFVWMLLALRWRRRRRMHAGMMAVLIGFDVLFPVWLYLTHDWVHRLIDEGELFSFLIWAHLFLALTLYALYGLQIQAGKQLLARREDARQNHRVQSKGIVLVRLFVFATGALLIAPGPN